MVEMSAEERTTRLIDIWQYNDETDTGSITVRTNIVSEIQAAVNAAYERACAAMCGWCAAGQAYQDDTECHVLGDGSPAACEATKIRALKESSE